MKSLQTKCNSLEKVNYFLKEEKLKTESMAEDLKKQMMDGLVLAVAQMEEAKKELETTKHDLEESKRRCEELEKGYQSREC